MKKLVLDIGGVFYLSHADRAFFERWSMRTGVPAAVLADRVWYGPDVEAANVGALSADQYCARAAVRLAIDPANVSRMINEAFTGGYNQELADFIRAARARGVSVCGLTNSWYSEAELMSRPALAGHFDFVVSSRDVGVTKPADQIYRLLLRRLDCRGNEAVFVDDTPKCVETAQALGFHTVLFQDTQQTIDALRPWLAPE